MSAFPEIAQLVPHAAPMLLLSRVVQHDGERTLCEAEMQQSALFAGADGSVPAWVGIEYMAQCVAAHAGLEARARGEEPRPGMLLGSRRVRIRADAFRTGQRLLVSARHHRGESGLVVFDCAVREAEDAEPLVECRLNSYVMSDWSEIERAARTPNGS